MRQNRNSSIARIAQITYCICAVCFALFSFLYLYVFQPDLVSQEQYAFSHGATSYSPLLGALLVTSILMLIAGVVHKFTRFSASCCSFALCVPSFLLSLVTCLRFDETAGYAMSIPYGRIFGVVLAYIIIYIICRMYSDLKINKDSFSSLLSPNMLILSASLFLTCLLGNGQNTLHHELRMARLVHEGRCVEALEVGVDAPPSVRLGTLRVAALLQSGDLAQRLFSFPMVEGSAQLLPSVSDSLCVFSPENGIYKILGSKPSDIAQWDVTRFLSFVNNTDSLGNEYVSQLLLCSYLLDRNLDAFVRELQLQTDSLSASMLPIHYREALALYHHQHPSLQYEDEETELHHAEFQRLMQSYASQSEKAYASRDLFRGTYWDYYFFCR